MSGEVFVGYNIATCVSESRFALCTSWLLVLTKPFEGRQVEHRHRSTMNASKWKKLRVEPHEKEYFLALMKENLDIINDRSVTPRSVTRKNECWEEITEKFNNVTGYKRTNIQVRKLWETIRKT